MPQFEITPRGPFSLETAAGFGFGPTEGDAPAFDGVLRYAFAVDGGGYAGVELRQPHEHGPVTGTVAGDGELAAVEAQVARVLSLDHDGEAYLEVGRRDPVIGELQAAYPGLRPVLFYSPYEAAAWAVIALRQRGVPAPAVRLGICRRLGESFELAGQQVAAFPQPERLVDADPADLEGLSDVKVERLRGIARAALDGALDVGRLHALGPDDAYVSVQELPGIGPFYAGLIVIRASGFADAPLLMAEPKVLASAAELYGLDEPPTLEQFQEMGEQWRPFRTWASVLLRYAGARR